MNENLYVDRLNHRIHHGDYLVVTKGDKTIYGNYYEPKIVVNKESIEGKAQLIVNRNDILYQCLFSDVFQKADSIEIIE